MHGDFGNPLRERPLRFSLVVELEVSAKTKLVNTAECDGRVPVFTTISRLMIVRPRNP